MKQKYNELYIDSGVRRFYDYFEKESGLPDGWRVYKDNWPDDRTSERVYYLVFCNDLYDFDVHVAFKYDFTSAYVANVMPTKVKRLDPDEYNWCLSKFVGEIVSWYANKKVDRSFDYVYRKLNKTEDKKPVFEAGASPVPAGTIDFTIGDDTVSVDLAAVIKADVNVSAIKEVFDPTNTESIFTTVKVYDRAEITVDKSKTDCFHTSSGKDPIQLLTYVSIIKNFKMYGSTYVPTLGDGSATTIAHTLGLILH
jgi:hypothetical protein